MDTETDYVLKTTHGVTNCALCAKAGAWALTQVKIIGTARGRDRQIDEHGSIHTATAWPDWNTTKGQ
jgi:hypothetical protein